MNADVEPVKRCWSCFVIEEGLAEVIVVEPPDFERCAICAPIRAQSPGWDQWPGWDPDQWPESDL